MTTVPCDCAMAINHSPGQCDECGGAGCAECDGAGLCPVCGGSGECGVEDGSCLTDLGRELLAKRGE